MLRRLLAITCILGLTQTGTAQERFDILIR